MSANQTNPIIMMAKLAAVNPAAAMTALLADTEEARLDTITRLRVYPAALIGLLRADNLPRALKPIIEEELALAGYKMMT